MRKLICIILSFTLLLCSCGRSNKLTAKNIAGDWKWEGETSARYYTFDKDGTGFTNGGTTVPGMDGWYASDITFTIDDDKLTIKDRNWEYEYTAKLSGDTLTLTDSDGSSREFTRYEK